MAKTVFKELEEAAAHHHEVTPSALVACVDPRLNPLINLLTNLITGLFVARNLGAFVDAYLGEQACDGASLADLLAGKLKWLIHVGHEGCAMAAAARTPSVLSIVLSPLLRLLRARGEVEATDMLHSRAQLKSL